MGGGGEAGGKFLPLYTSTLFSVRVSQKSQFDLNRKQFLTFDITDCEEKQKQNFLIELIISFIGFRLCKFVYKLFPIIEYSIFSRVFV